MKQSIYNNQVKINNIDIIYNSFSNRFISVTPDILDCLSGNYSNHNVLNGLRNARFLVEDDENEKDLVMNCYLRRKFSLRVYQLIINTSLDCNLQCWYCYETHIKKSFISSDVVLNILKHIELKFISEPFEVLELSFFGGEPMLNYKAISDLLQHVKSLMNKYGFKVLLTIVTNGTCINKRYIDLLRDFKTRFQITMDGDECTHNSIRKFKDARKGNSYKYIINGLKLLSESKANFYFTIRVNYDSNVIKNIVHLINDLSFLNREKTIISLQKVWQCKLDEINTQKLFDVIGYINTQKFFVDIYGFSSKFCSCYANNYNQAIINYDGKVYKCTARDFVKDRSYGVLNSEGIIVWDIGKLKKRLSLNAPQKCIDCSLFPSCKGLCSQKIIECEDIYTLPSLYDKELSKSDIVLHNIKQKLIERRNEV